MCGAAITIAGAEALRSRDGMKKSAQDCKRGRGGETRVGDGSGAASDAARAASQHDEQQ